MSRFWPPTLHSDPVGAVLRASQHLSRPAQVSDERAYCLCVSTAMLLCVQHILFVNGAHMWSYSVLVILSHKVVLHC